PMRAVLTRVKDAWRALEALRGLYTQLVVSALRQGAKLPPGNVGRAMFARFGDHRYYLDQFQRHGAVFRVVWSERLTICVVGFKRAKQLFSLHARLLLPLTVNLEPFVPHGFIRGMTPDVHPKYRRIFLSALDDRLLDIWEADFRAK